MPDHPRPLNAVRIDLRLELPAHRLKSQAVQITAEIRWFFAAHAAPGQLAGWFRDRDAHGCEAGGCPTREDRYLNDVAQVELGIKQRGDLKGVEVKGLVSVVDDELQATPFCGRIEIWAKWSLGRLELPADGVVVVRKQRWLRQFITGPVLREVNLRKEDGMPIDGAPPKRGCNVELTTITLGDGEVWWTLGFEAFGDLATVVGDLRAVAETVASRRAPGLAGGMLASYPAWLSRRPGDRVAPPQTV